MDSLTHGKLTTYVNQRCRCPQCAAASRDYGRARYRLRAYGQLPQLTDVETVRAHIGWLSTHGIGWEQVALLAQVGRTTVDEIAHPSSGRAGVTGRVANAILGVLPSMDNAASAALIPAAGTARRLQALMRTGWSLCAIQAATTTTALGRVLTRELVTARVARAVRDFYDSHWDQPPTSSTPAQRGVIDRTIARARTQGFLPALAWDDDTIDDPVTEPDPAAGRTSRGVRVHVEDIEFLARLGVTWDQVQTRTGACRNTVEAALRRGGRPDLISRITQNRRVAA